MKRSRLIEIAENLASEGEFSLCDEEARLAICDESVPDFCAGFDDQVYANSLIYPRTTNLESDELDDAELVAGGFDSTYSDKESDAIALEKAGYSEYVIDNIIATIEERAEAFAERLSERVRKEISEN